MSLAEIDEGPAALTGVVDDEQLFRYSLMVDSVRDAAWALIGVGADNTTVSLLAAQFNRLHRSLCRCLTRPKAAETRRLVPMAPEQVTVAGVYFCASQLAQWADGLMQLPGFRVKRKVLAHQAQQMIDATEAASLVEATPAHRSGSYL